jgi:hypothetical protein
MLDNRVLMDLGNGDQFLHRVLHNLPIKLPSSNLSSLNGSRQLPLSLHRLSLFLQATGRFI